MTDASFPQFVVVTPTYNQGQYLEQAIKSVLAQPELLSYWVMDGGSQDGTKKILQKYEGRLFWVSRKDNGQTHALNQGVKKLWPLSAKNKELFFAYLNSDDYYLPGAFKKVAEAFAKHPHQKWLVGDALIVDQKGAVIQEWIRLYKKWWRVVFGWGGGGVGLKVVNPLPQPAVFVRSSAVKEIGQFDEKLYYTMDYDYWLRLYQKFGSPIYLNQTLAAFRIHGQSKGEQGFVDQFAEQLQVAQKFTSNSILLGLQKLHNLLIVSLYHLIK